MALCTSEGIRFIVNTKEPYTGAIYAQDRFSSCNRAVENSKQIVMTFPPPTVSTDCGTQLKVGSSFFCFLNDKFLDLKLYAGWKIRSARSRFARWRTSASSHHRMGQILQNYMRYNFERNWRRISRCYDHLWCWVITQHRKFEWHKLRLNRIKNLIVSIVIPFLKSFLLEHQVL